MSDEKHNNSTHPDYGLDALDEIPGEAPLDKNHAWEKLYLLLHKNNRIKTGYPYWIAAACILFALFFFGISGLHKEKLPLLTHTGNKPAADSAVLPQAVVKTYHRDKRASLVRKPDQKKKGNPRSSLAPAKIKISGQPLNQAENTAGAEPNKLPPVHPQEIQPKPDAVLNSPAIANARPNVLKKKLRVVHLNELDEPPASVGGLAKNSGRPLFHLKWNEPPATINNISENIYANNGLVKIRLSSPN